jgi:hypothetical protein
MKIGDRVTVYQDPFTALKPEGEATVVRIIEDRPCGSDCREVRAEVRFKGERLTYPRTIFLFGAEPA